MDPSLPCYTLVCNDDPSLFSSSGSYTSSLSLPDLRSLLQKPTSSDEVKLDVMRTIVVGTLNGVDYSALLMPIIQYVLPSRSKAIKRILHFYWEICPKTDAEGKMKQEMILVCNAIRNDLVSAGRFCAFLVSFLLRLGASLFPFLFLRYCFCFIPPSSHSTAFPLLRLRPRLSQTPPSSLSISTSFRPRHDFFSYSVVPPRTHLLPPSSHYPTSFLGRCDMSSKVSCSSCSLYNRSIILHPHPSYVPVPSALIGTFVTSFFCLLPIRTPSPLPPGTILSSLSRILCSLVLQTSMCSAANLSNSLGFHTTFAHL